MENKNKYVVTITRQFGSLGRPIARLMSQKLGIDYFDRDIVEEASRKLNLPVSRIDELEERAEKSTRNGFMRMMYPLGTQVSSVQDKVFETQKNIMQFFAERESCIIVGRCSDFIFSDRPDSMHIYIYAPYNARVRNCIQNLKLEEQEAKKMIRSVDEAREQYHLHYAVFRPEDQRFKNIMIDSSMFGMERTADFLVDAVKRRFRLTD